MKETSGQQFMRQTRYENLSPRPQEQGMPQPPLELPVPEGAKLIELPRPDCLSSIPSIDLRTAIDKRKTIRQYSEQSLTLEELSYLLWCTQGVKKVSERPVTLRTVPSAGARHAFETYLLINKVEGLQPGLYRFAAIEHALLGLDFAEDLNSRITEACHEQEQVTNSAATFMWAAVLDRMYWRYVERGYRYLLLDAGHVCQNLYLAAEAVHCGVCGIAAYDDVELNTALGLDGDSMFVVYAASLGKRTR